MEPVRRPTGYWLKHLDRLIHQVSDDEVLVAPRGVAAKCRNLSGLRTTYSARMMPFSISNATVCTAPSGASTIKPGRPLIIAKRIVKSSRHHAPGGRLLVTTGCQGGSPMMDLLNLWAASTAGCGLLPVADELVAQMKEAGFAEARAKRLVPGDSFAVVGLT
jgi:hypothetical protein